MDEHRAVIILSPDRALHLSNILEALNREAVFPFQLHPLHNPSPQQIDLALQKSPGLFFIHSKYHETEQIASWLNRYRPLGHQIVLLADPAEDYLDLAIRYGVGNILFDGQYDLPMVRAVIQRLLGSDFFGFAPFFPDSWPEYDQQVVLAGAVQRVGLVDRLFHDYLDRLSDQQLRHRFHTHISELITNALAYGVMGITPEQRDQHFLSIPSVVEIPTGREIKIHLVQDHEKYGISVKDREGGLTLLRILQKLRRHTPLPGNPIPAGLEDLTGRGLYIVSRQNRLVINILHGIQTEVILLSYFSEERNRYQSLIINEKNPIPGETISL